MNKDDNGFGRQRRLIRDALRVKVARELGVMFVWSEKRCCVLPNADESDSGFDGGSRDVTVENISRHPAQVQQAHQDKAAR